MKPRRLSYLMLVPAVSILFAACGSSSITTQPVTPTPSLASQVAPSAIADTPSPAASASSATDLEIGNPTPALCGGHTYTIGFDIYSDTDPTAVATIAGFKQVATSLGCVTPIVLIDNADPATALKNVQTFVQRKVDGVILAQVIQAAQPGIMRALNDAKIPAVSTFITAPGATFINPDNRSVGAQGGQALGQAFVAASPTAIPWVIVGAFPAAGTASNDRMGGFVDGVQVAIPTLPADHVLTIDTKADPPTANTETKSVLARIPKGDKILFSGVNDTVTFAMLQGIRDAGRGADAMGMGFGGDPTGLGFVCKNAPQYYGTVEFFAEKAGGYLLPAVLGVIQGKSVPNVISEPTQVLIKDTIPQLYPSVSC